MQELLIWALKHTAASHSLRRKSYDTIDLIIAVLYSLLVHHTLHLGNLVAVSRTKKLERLKFGLNLFVIYLFLILGTFLSATCRLLPWTV